MIEWLTWLGVGIAVLAGSAALIAGLRGRVPSDYTVGGLVLLEVYLIAQAITAIVQPFVGNPPTGDALEFWMYVITAILMPILAVVWALVDRTRFGTIALGVTGLAIAVMIVRMATIWGS